MGKPMKVVCELGVWKTAQTVFQDYQQADEGDSGILWSTSGGLTPEPNWGTADRQFLYVQWALLDSNQRPPACKAGALNQLS